jgi:hypothetical protein
LQPECRPLQRLAPPSLGQNPARMNKATFTGRCSESQQQSACESSVQGLDLEVWRWGQVLASARCQLVPAGKRKSRGGTTFPSAHDDIEPGPHWQPAHFGPVSPDRPPHCQWQPLSLLPVPLATSRCRGQARGHWQRSQPGAPSTRGPLPVPVESGAGGPCQWPRASHWQRWQPHCTPDLAGAQVQVAARLGRKSGPPPAVSICTSIVSLMITS